MTMARRNRSMTTTRRKRSTTTTRRIYLYCCIFKIFSPQFLNCPNVFPRQQLAGSDGDAHATSTAACCHWGHHCWLIVFCQFADSDEKDLGRHTNNRLGVVPCLVIFLGSSSSMLSSMPSSMSSSMLLSMSSSMSSSTLSSMSSSTSSSTLLLPFYPRLQETNSSCHCLFQAPLEQRGSFFHHLILIRTTKCF